MNTNLKFPVISQLHFWTNKSFQMCMLDFFLCKMYDFVSKLLAKQFNNANNWTVKEKKVVATQYPKLAYFSGLWGWLRGSDHY